MDEQFLKAFFCFFVKLFLPFFPRPDRPIQRPIRPMKAEKKKHLTAQTGAGQCPTPACKVCD
jgi:hypothetical protein